MEGGGGVDPEKVLNHAAARKKFLGLLGGPRRAPPENFENIVFRIG